MRKEKSKAQRENASSVSFIVEQQLEACLDALKYNSEPFNLEIKMPQRANHDDSVGFSALVYQGGIPRSRITGVMRRWGGTSTRVEATVTLMNEAPRRSPNGDELQILLGFWVFYFGSPLLLYLLVRFDESWLLPLICVYGLSLIPAYILFRVLRTRRARDRQIDRLKAALTAKI